MPFVVLALYGLHRARLGVLGLVGAGAYGYAFLFFSGTVLYALAAGAPDWAAVVEGFGPWMTAHGVVMVAGGTALGAAVVRSAAFPRWTGVCLAVGVVLVAAASGLPTAARATAAVLPAVALAGMGVAVLARPTHDVVTSAPADR